MCCTFTSTSVFPLRSVLVVTVPAAAGAMPVLVSLSSLDQAAVEIRKVMAMNNAILVCRMCVSPCSGRVSRALMSNSDVGFSHLRCRRSGAAFVFLPPRMPGAPIAARGCAQLGSSRSICVSDFFNRSDCIQYSTGAHFGCIYGITWRTHVCIACPGPRVLVSGAGHRTEEHLHALGRQPGGPHLQSFPHIQVF